MQEFFSAVLADPYGYIAVFLGLVMASAIILSSAIMLITVAVSTLRQHSARRTYKKIALLLREVMLRNSESNPQLAALAAILMKTLDPSSDLFYGDLEAARITLNLPTAEELVQEAKLMTPTETN